MESPPPPPRRPPRGTIRHVDDLPPLPWSWRRAGRVGAWRAAIVVVPLVLLGALAGSARAIATIAAHAPLVAAFAAVELWLASRRAEVAEVRRWTLGAWALSVPWSWAALVQGDVVARLLAGRTLPDALDSVLADLGRVPASGAALLACGLLGVAAPLPTALWVRLLGTRLDASCLAALAPVLAGLLLPPLLVAALVWLVAGTAAVLLAYGLVDLVCGWLDPPWRYRRPDA